MLEDILAEEEEHTEDIINLLGGSVGEQGPVTHIGHSSTSRPAELTV